MKMKMEMKDIYRIWGDLVGIGRRRGEGMKLGWLVDWLAVYDRAKERGMGRGT